MSDRYRSTPQEIEAVQWTGSNPSEVAKFAPEVIEYADGQLWVVAGKDGAQGSVPVPIGHWIVRNPGDMSDHWPVDPDYFARKYEPVTDAGDDTLRQQLIDAILDTNHNGLQCGEGADGRNPTPIPEVADALLPLIRDHVAAAVRAERERLAASVIHAIDGEVSGQ